MSDEKKTDNENKMNDEKITKNNVFQEKKEEDTYRNLEEKGSTPKGSLGSKLVLGMAFTFALLSLFISYIFSKGLSSQIDSIDTKIWFLDASLDKNKKEINNVKNDVSSFNNNLEKMENKMTGFEKTLATTEKTIVLTELKRVLTTVKGISDRSSDVIKDRANQIGSNITAMINELEGNIARKEIIQEESQNEIPASKLSLTLEPLETSGAQTNIEEEVEPVDILDLSKEVKEETTQSTDFNIEKHEDLEELLNLTSPIILNEQAGGTPVTPEAQKNIQESHDEISSQRDIEKSNSNSDQDIFGLIEEKGVEQSTSHQEDETAELNPHSTELSSQENIQEVTEHKDTMHQHDENIEKHEGITHPEEGVGHNEESSIREEFNLDNIHELNEESQSSSDKIHGETEN